MPWQPVAPGLELELVKEVGTQHPLYQQKAVAVARRLDNDDVLFVLPESALPLAVVHLTWKGSPETSPEWPATKFYASVAAWVENCMKADHLE
jgi:hypothetical protein